MSVSSGIRLALASLSLAAFAACTSAGSDDQSPPIVDPTAVTTPEPTAAAIGQSPLQAPTAAPAGAQGEPVTLVGAGDIAKCDSTGDEAVANVLDGIPGTIFTTGDNVYPDGTAGQFASCYEPSWGRHKARTRPSPGNHDYNTTGAGPYYAYFGANAGPPGQGYFSYDVGAWHAISLNSNCSRPDVSCGPGSDQQTWLEADLQANQNVCTVAYWHHPILTIGPHANDEEGMLSIWQMLYDYDVDVVLTGHEHSYQRYAPLNRDQTAVDTVNGMSYFVVGTGGANLTNGSATRANSNPGMEAWGDIGGDGDGHDAAFGVLKLTLHETSYDWQFVPVAGQTFTDSGQDTCHDLPDHDSDGVSDAEDNCPHWSNASQDPPEWPVATNDTDCDGFDAAQEQGTGTNSQQQCAATMGAGDEHPDSWPTDNDDNRRTNLGDVSRLGPSYNSVGPNPPYNARFDLNADARVNLSDASTFGPYYNKPCG